MLKALCYATGAVATMSSGGELCGAVILAVGAALVRHSTAQSAATLRLLRRGSPRAAGLGAL
jgi:hypothetical protein